MSNAKIFAEGVLLDSENWTKSNIEITNRYHKSWNHNRNFNNSKVPPLNQVPSYLKEDHKKKLANLCLSDQWTVTPHQIEIYDNNFIEKNQQGFPSKIILSEIDTCLTENTGKYHLGQPLQQHFDLPAGEVRVSIQTLINTANADRSKLKTYDSLIITGKQAISNPDLENAKWMTVNQDNIDEISLKVCDIDPCIIHPEITTDDIKTAIESYDYKSTPNQKNTIEEISSVVVHPADNSNGVFIRKDGSRHPMFKIEITSVFGIEKTTDQFRKTAPFHDTKPCPCCCDCDGCQEFGIHKPSFNRFNFERKLTVVTPRVYATNFSGELIRSGPDGKDCVAGYKKIKSTIKMDSGNYDEDKVIVKTKGKIDKPKKDVLKNMVVRDKRRRKTFRKPFNKQISYE